jgi:hypothetical protein
LCISSDLAQFDTGAERQRSMRNRQSIGEVCATRKFSIEASISTIVSSGSAVIDRSNTEGYFGGAAGNAARAKH